MGATSASQVRVAMALISWCFGVVRSTTKATNGDHQRAADSLKDTHGDKDMHLGGGRRRPRQG